MGFAASHRLREHTRQGDAVSATVLYIELERTRILEGEGGVTHMHYRVQR
jgi:hypothetical protein